MDVVQSEPGAQATGQDPALALGVRTDPRILRRVWFLRHLYAAFVQDAPARGRNQTGHHHQA